jgi:hypothetical protein
MFFIKIIFKTGTSKKEEVQNLGVIVQENLSIVSLIDDITTVSKQVIIDEFGLLLENYNINQIISEIISFQEHYYLKIYDLITDYLFKLSYAQITSITLEDFLSARFLPDYHVIEYLSKEAQLDRYSVSKVLVALSNLLRDCQAYDVRQINAISLRIHKAIMNENRTVFVITEF